LPGNRVIKFWLHVLPFPRKGLSLLKSLLLTPKLKAFENLDGDGAEGSLEGSDSTLSPPLAEYEVQSVDKKRKRLEDLTSSGSSKPKDVPLEESTSKDRTLFNFLGADS
jgi:hypothetical protein